MKTLLAAITLSLAACASTMAATAPAGTASNCEPAKATRGATVYQSPDSTSPQVAVLKDDAQVCADPSIVGFGYHRVKLSDGKVGFIYQDELNI